MAESCLNDDESEEPCRGMDAAQRRAPTFDVSAVHSQNPHCNFAFAEDAQMLKAEASSIVRRVVLLSVDLKAE